MGTPSRGASGAALASLLLIVAGCGADDGTGASVAPDEPSQSGSATPSPTQSEPAGGSSDPAAPAPGAYVEWEKYDADRAAYSATDVVLFFHADWCPKCQELQDSLDGDGVPAGLTVVKVDFDTESDLRKEYGVTVQHTMVHIDESGEKLDLWTGSYTGADIADHLA